MYLVSALKKQWQVDPWVFKASMVYTRRIRMPRTT